MKDQDKTKEQLIEELEKLHQELRLYKMIVEKMPLALTVWELEDLDNPGAFRLLACNPQIEEATGAPYREFIGTTVRETFPSSLETEGPHIYAEAVRAGQVRELPDLRSPGDEQTAAGVYSVTVVPLGGRIAAVFCENITERKQAEEKIKQRNLELAALNAITTTMMQSALDLDEVLQRTADGVVEGLDCNTAFIFLLDEEGEVFKGGAVSTKDKMLERMNAIIGFPLLQIEIPARRDFNEAMSNLLDGRPTIQHDLYELVKPLFSKPVCYAIQRLLDSKTFFTMPLIAKGKTVGGIVASTREELSEGETEKLMTFANQAAIAIENARLFQESQRRADEMAALREVNLATLSTLEREQVFEIMLDQLGTVIDYDTAAIHVVTPDGRQKMIAGRGPIIYDQAMWDGFDVKDNKLYQEMKETRQPIVIHDTHTDEHFERVGDWETFHSWAGAPLFVRGDSIGYLAVEKTSPGFYDEKAVQLLSDFAHAAAIAIENARLYDAVQQELTERKRAERLLQGLNQAALAMGKAMSPEEIFAVVASELKKLGFSCVVFLTDESQSRLLIRYFSYEARAIEALEKLTGLKIENFSIPIETTDVYRKVVQERKAAFIENVEDVTRQFLPKPLKKFAGQIMRRLKIAKSIRSPLVVEDEVIGLFSVESDDLTEDDVPAITAFAHQMAAAWRKAQLMQDLERSLIEQKRAREELRQSFEKLRGALEGTVNVLASAIETRDPYTANHQQRVTQLAYAIAKEMGLPEGQIEGLRIATLIHDIGKINVPAEILSKPGPLTELEFGFIKMHPQVGYDILKEIEFPWPVAQIVLQHHERTDGSGYPAGLSGEEIILEARILAVADVVEAMASHRPYRPARGIDLALEEISQNRGIIYDPEVVEACSRLFTEKGFKLE